MKSTKAAGRYAKSLLSLAIERGELEKVKDDMALVSQTVGDSTELYQMLQSPIIKSDKKTNVLNALFSKNVSPLSLSFITLLTSKGREPILGAVADAFIDLYRSHMGIINAEIISATPLTAEWKKALKEALSSSGKSIDLTEKVDSSILGGLRVKVGDQLIDASIRRKLNDLKVEISKQKLSAN